MKIEVDTLFMTMYFTKILLIDDKDNKLLMAFYMEINFPQYVLMLINLLQCKTNIILFVLLLLINFTRYTLVII